MYPSSGIEVDWQFQFNGATYAPIEMWQDDYLRYERLNSNPATLNVFSLAHV
jgi:hypothetical protein